MKVRSISEMTSDFLFLLPLSECVKFLSKSHATTSCVFLYVCSKISINNFSHLLDRYTLCLKEIFIVRLESVRVQSKYPATISSSCTKMDAHL